MVEKTALCQRVSFALRRLYRPVMNHWA
jgi:hypothetical protein